MTVSKFLSATLFAAILAIATHGLTLPAFSAQADIDMLKSYLGDWKGRGETTTANGTEAVACHLAITDAGTEKINYNGRCTLAGGTISIAGTMAFVTANNRFEAVMSSSTSFAGVAIGRRRGKGIDFDLRDRDAESGKVYEIKAGIMLDSGDITVDFMITEVESGRVTKASVPFAK